MYKIYITLYLVLFFRKEVQFQEEKNRELTDRLNSLTNDFTTLRQQYIFLQNSTEENKNSILHNLAQEKKYRNIAEEECKVKTKVSKSQYSFLHYYYIIYNFRTFNLLSLNSLKTKR